VLATLTAPTDAADRLARIVEALCRAVAARGGRGLAGPLIILVWGRLRRLAARFTALAARVRAGRVAPRPDPRTGRRRSRRDPAKLLPERFAWLVRVAPGAAAGAAQLQHLLLDPDMAALIAAAPQAGRILRPLCRMLGVIPPPALARPRRPRQPATPTGPAAPARLPAPPAPAEAAAPSPGQPREPAPPAAPPAGPRPRTRRPDGIGWVPRRRMFLCRPPGPA
jgi:hypothetical protein